MNGKGKMAVSRIGARLGPADELSGYLSLQISESDPLGHCEVLGTGMESDAC